MDMLFAESRIFLRRRDTESITAILAARAQKPIGNMSCFVPLSPQVPRLAFAAAKRCLQSGNRDLLGSPWFVAAGVLTAEMMMWGFDRLKDLAFSNQLL